MFKLWFVQHAGKICNCAMEIPKRSVSSANSTPKISLPTDHVLAGAGALRQKASFRIFKDNGQDRNV